MQQELTDKVISCATKVYSELGNGFPDSVYRKALEIEMDLAGLEFEDAGSIKIFHRNVFVGFHRIDFLVDQKLLLEIYTRSSLDTLELPRDLDVTTNEINTCLLINFGAVKLEYKTVFYNVFHRN